MRTPKGAETSGTYSSALTSLPLKYRGNNETGPRQVQECIGHYQEKAIPEDVVLALINQVGPIAIEDIDMAAPLASYYENSETGGCPCTLEQLGQVGKGMTIERFDHQKRSVIQSSNYHFGTTMAGTVPLHKNEAEPFKKVLQTTGKVRNAGYLIFDNLRRYQPDLTQRVELEISCRIMTPVEMALERKLIRNTEELEEVCALVITLAKSNGGQWDMEKIVDNATSLKVLKYLLKLCAREVFPWSGMQHISHWVDLTSLEGVSDDVLEKSLTVQVMSTAPDDLTKFLLANGAKEPAWGMRQK